MTDDDRQRAYWEAEHGHRAYDHPVVRTFASQRVALLRRRLDLGAVRTALDVGCGNGFSTYYVAPAVTAIWAVDRSRYMLARHPLRTAGRLAAADALALPFGDARFDLVYGWEVLHHIPEPLLAVREMARVARRWIVLAEPNPVNPAQLAFALWDREHRWVLRYRRRYLRNLCERAGLRVIDACTGGWLFPNVTPPQLLVALTRLPYTWPLGITNWVFAEKP